MRQPGTTSLGSVVAVAFLGATRLLAQNADLSGLITDPPKLAVPRAQVLVESTATSATRTVFSNNQGEYSAPALEPGSYNIAVEASGFKTIHENGVVLEVDQQARSSFSLEVGAKQESIVVEASAALLNTSDASVSTLIGNRFVENLPLNGRSFSSRSTTPTSARPVNYLSSPLFGQSTQMLGASLGTGGQNGGLNPLYQIGGPRSVQLALKLVF